MKSNKISTLLILLISSLTVFAQGEHDPSDKQYRKMSQQNDSVYYTCSMHTDVQLNKPGKCPRCGMELVQKILTPEKQMQLNDSLYFTCATHPEVAMDDPGKCPLCGMDLVQKKKKPYKKELENNSVYYFCTMHPDVRMMKPGKCPQCGMELTKKVMQTEGIKRIFRKIKYALDFYSIDDKTSIIRDKYK